MNMFAIWMTSLSDWLSKGSIWGGLIVTPLQETTDGTLTSTYTNNVSMGFYSRLSHTSQQECAFNHFSGGLDATMSLHGPLKVQDAQIFGGYTICEMSINSPADGSTAVRIPAAHSMKCMTHTPANKNTFYLPNNLSDGSWMASPVGPSNRQTCVSCSVDFIQSWMRTIQQFTLRICTECVCVCADDDHVAVRGNSRGHITSPGLASSNDVISE